jgi:adenylosuccinate synthase
MEKNKFNVLLDQAWGSSGKGKMATWLTDYYGVTQVSSSNYPNAGHTTVLGDRKFVAKAIPTAAALKAFKGTGIHCWISPGSGFNPVRLIEEWREAGKPRITIHGRANVVTDAHKQREQEGKDSTKHLASTMQGTAAALTDKILRKADCQLARDIDWTEWTQDEEFLEKVWVLEGDEFRDQTRQVFDRGETWFHEGSQGYALSIDHGSHFPFCTSRNCTLQAAMDHMAIPPKLVGDVYLNIRTTPIRVGNVIENGKQMGYSGDFYPDCQEITWEQVAADAGMPPEEAENLKAREFTTVTGRLRRVATFSLLGLKDAVKTNGATKLLVNFIQYIDWNDRGLKGGREAFHKLSKKSRAFIDKLESETGVQVVLIGTGAHHDELINLLDG